MDKPNRNRDIGLNEMVAEISGIALISAPFMESLSDFLEIIRVL